MACGLIEIDLENPFKFRLKLFSSYPSLNKTTAILLSGLRAAVTINSGSEFIASIISFIYFYFVIFFILTALLSLTGLDFITAISGAATSISNVGPGLGPIIGPNGDFSTLPDISKWILTMGMILGRLELFAILALFLPSFWRN